MIHLPAEILASIFVDVLQLEFNDDLPILHPTLPPLSLERVCIQWRDTVDSTPHLWTRLHLPSLPDGNVESPHIFFFLRQIERWLSRSGVFPLDMTVNASWPDRSNELEGPRATRSFLDVLCRHSRRWRVMKFTMDYPNWFPSLEADSLPVLECLDIHTNPERPAATPSIHLQNAEIAPRLRSVNIEADEIISLKLPWSQLTQLRLDNSAWVEYPLDHTLTFQALRVVLGKCASLRTLSLSVSIADTYLRWRDGDQVIMPELRTLHLDVLSSVMLSTLLRTVVAPHLHILDLRPTRNSWWNTSALSSLREMVKIHGSTLQVIRLPKIGIDDGLPRDFHLHSLLAGATNLRALECDVVDLTSDTLRSLVLAFSDSGLLVAGRFPRLVAIKLGNEHGAFNPSDVNLFMDRILFIIESRQWLTEGAVVPGGTAVGRLMAFDLQQVESRSRVVEGTEEGTENLDESIRDRVQALKDDGFVFCARGIDFASSYDFDF